MTAKLIGICLLVACLFEAGNAVKCYQCESISNSACGEDFNHDKIQVIDCSHAVRPRYIMGNANSTSCVKMVREDFGKETIVRACFFKSSMDSSSNCLSDPNARYVYKSCDLCTEDLCNGSSRIGGSIILFLVTYIVFKVFNM